MNLDHHSKSKLTLHLWSVCTADQVDVKEAQFYAYEVVEDIWSYIGIAKGLVEHLWVQVEIFNASVSLFAVFDM